MTQTESRKGQQCDIKPILCQEGFCQDCQIYLDFQGHQRTMGRISSSIYPILRKQIQAKRDEAFAESAYGTRTNKLVCQSRIDAYDVVLGLIDKKEKWDENT